MHLWIQYMRLQYVCIPVHSWTNVWFLKLAGVPGEVLSRGGRPQWSRLVWVVHLRPSSRVFSTFSVPRTQPTHATSSRGPLLDTPPGLRLSGSPPTKLKNGLAESQLLSSAQWRYRVVVYRENVGVVWQDHSFCVFISVLKVIQRWLKMRY